MSTFQLSKYMNDEEKDIASKEPADVTDGDGKPSEGRKAVKEIQITSLKDEEGTAIVAKALMQVLRKDKIDMMDINEHNDRIFKEIKVVTADDVKNNLGEATKFALEGNADVIVLPEARKLMEGEVLMNNLADKENVYLGVKDFYKRSSLGDFTEEDVISMDADQYAEDDANELIRVIKEEQVSMEEITITRTLENDSVKYRVGDNTPQGVIVFVDDLVVLFRKENATEVKYVAMERA